MGEKEGVAGGRATLGVHLRNPVRGKRILEQRGGKTWEFL